MPLQKPCQSAPTMAGGMVLVTILRENGVEVLHRPPLVAQVSARRAGLAGRALAGTGALWLARARSGWHGRPDAASAASASVGFAAYSLHVALAAIELAAQFSRACGRNCFELSFQTLLHAVRACCCDASEETLEWLAAATGAGALIINHRIVVAKG